MSETGFPGGPRPPRVPARPWPSEGVFSAVAWTILFVLLFVFLPIFIWFFCRIEPGPGQIAVLIKKTGQDLPSGQILAERPEQKGIQLPVLAEGRKWRNPYTWSWKYYPITEIPPGKVGVLTRLFGKDLPAGLTLAPDDQTKGIVRDVLAPGRHRINPFAYSNTLSDAINIHAGSVGVKVSLVGKDMLNNDMGPEQRNRFLVEPEVKGVMSDVLIPATYYLNPYVYEVVEVNLQSQRFAVSGDDAINFLTIDGFTVVVEGTIEFAVEQDKAALLTHRVGEMNEIVQKLIVPRMRGFCRTEGSKHPAIDFIVGQTRQKFQSDLDAHLRRTCEDWGVLIKSVLIRNIIPPDEIASIIRDREVAVQESKRYDQEIKQAKSKAELTKQEMLAVQNKEKVEADTVRIRAVIGAEQEQNVKVITAKQEMEVARIDMEAAAAQAKAILSKASAEADVIKMQNTAEAGVIKGQVKAFNNGLNLARYTFYRRIAPRIESILSSDQQEGLGGLFLPYVPASGKEVK